MSRERSECRSMLGEHSAPVEMEAIHGWFGLSYASWLCLPRTLLQSMPVEWQSRFVALLREYDDHWHDLPDDYLPRSYTVMPVERGRFVSWDSFGLPPYSRGRTQVERDGTVRRYSRSVALSEGGATLKDSADG